MTNTVNVIEKSYGGTCPHGSYTYVFLLKIFTIYSLTHITKTTTTSCFKSRPRHYSVNYSIATVCNTSLWNKWHWTLGLSFKKEEKK